MSAGGAGGFQAGPGVECCEGCGAVVPAATTPTHDYVGASRGCWALYGEVLAREYSDIRFAGVHRLTVDAYSVQHPGVPGPRSTRSVAIHLIGLHVTLELGFENDRAVATLQRAAEDRERYTWLDPPWPRGALTILDVHRERVDPAAHHRVVQAWAADVWNAWTPHHAEVRAWARLALEPRVRRASRQRLTPGKRDS